MLEIPEREIWFKTSRSSGPGGQHVNKVSSRVTVFFNVRESGILTERQKSRVLKRLSTRADKSGVIRVSSQKHRSQKANKQAAVVRLQCLITNAIKKRIPRKKTRPPKWAKEERLKQKKQHSEKKKLRSQKNFEF